MDAAMFRGGPARTGAFPGEHPGSGWIFRTRSAVKSSPTVFDGAIYAADLAGLIYAVNASTGKLRWSVQADGGIDGSVTVVDDTAYVGTGHGCVCAISCRTGRELWTYRGAGLSGMSTPAVSRGLVVIGGPDGTVLALSQDSGTPRWSYRAGMPLIPQDPNSRRNSGALHSSPLIVEDVVYVTDGRLLALDLASGEQRWQSAALGASTSSPTMGAEVLYTTELDAVCAVEPGRGALRWRTVLDDALLMWSTPAVADEILVVCGRKLGYRLGGGLVAGLDATTGALRWRTATPGPATCGAALHNGRAYVTVAGNQAHLLVLQVATGATVGRIRLPSPMPTSDFVSSPARFADAVCVGLLGGALLCAPAEPKPAGRGLFRRAKS